MRKRELTLPILLLVSFLCSCSREQSFPDLPSFIAESDETTIAQSAALIERCGRSFPGGRVGELHFTHSEKWGDILRVDMPDNPDTRVISRMVCTEKTENVAVGTVPTGGEELLPEAMRGVWAPDGQCETLAKRAIFSATAVAMGEQRPSEMRYFPQGKPLGEGVLWWTNGTWSQFEYDAAGDVMRWTDKSGVTTYRRCSEQR